jgi:protocatechuate 3,4-dioxygenase beta subunit
MLHKLRFLSFFVLIAALLSACSGINPSANPSSSPTSQAASQALIPLTAAQATETLAAAQPAAPSSTAALPAATAVPSPAVTQAAVACKAPAALTPAETEGPYFKAGSPETTSLIGPGITGTHLLLTGYVLTQDCQPVANALLDFWQANAQGQYDNSGYTLRGHQFTDAGGRYQLETIVPGLYPGRTLHIHVKVQAPNGPILTSQVFFPGIQQNDSDSIYNPRLLIAVQDTSVGMLGSYNFVISLK